MRPRLLTRHCLSSPVAYYLAGACSVRQLAATHCFPSVFLAYRSCCLLIKTLNYRFIGKNLQVRFVISLDGSSDEGLPGCLLFCPQHPLQKEYYMIHAELRTRKRSLSATTVDGRRRGRRLPRLPRFSGVHFSSRIAIAAARPKPTTDD